MKTLRSMPTAAEQIAGVERLRDGLAEIAALEKRIREKMLRMSYNLERHEIALLIRDFHERYSEFAGFVPDDIITLAVTQPPYLRYAEGYAAPEFRHILPRDTSKKPFAVVNGRKYTDWTEEDKIRASLATEERSDNFTVFFAGGPVKGLQMPLDNPPTLGKFIREKVPSKTPFFVWQSSFDLKAEWQPRTYKFLYDSNK